MKTMSAAWSLGKDSGAPTKHPLGSDLEIINMPVALGDESSNPRYQGGSLGVGAYTSLPASLCKVLSLSGVCLHSNMEAWQPTCYDRPIDSNPGW